jgi:hypothetical protein
VRITKVVKTFPHFAGLILVGSMASGRADPLSDIDLIVVAQGGRFDPLWQRREKLHVTGALGCWDRQDAQFPQAGMHAWLTQDLVLVEALITTPGSGVRIADPAVVLAGSMDLLTKFPRRPPVLRSEMQSTEDHPIDAAYAALKGAVRSKRLGV